MNDDELWNQLRQGLLKSPSNATEKEEFVSKVMARLPQHQSIFLGAWWKIPALILSSLVILVLAPNIQESSPSVESLLLSDASSEQAQQLIHQSSIETDDLFNLLTEDSRS